jgi:hypothetical protein
MRAWFCNQTCAFVPSGFIPVGDTSSESERPPFGTSGVSHCEEEDAFAFVARANFRRCE